MKQSQIGPAVTAGEKLLAGEFREWNAEEREKRDKRGSFHVFEKAFLVIGRDCVEVTNFIRDGRRAADLDRPQLKVGDRVLVRFTAYGRTPYGVRAEGQLEPVEPG